MKIQPVLLIISSLLLVGWEGLAQSKQVKFKKISGTEGISLGKINNITRDIDGFLWLSAQDNRAIIRYDGRHMVMYQYDPNKPEGLGGYYPECIIADPYGIVWIGFYGQGIDSFDPQTNIFTHYRHDPNDPESLSDDVVSALLVDRNGNLWAGTNSGLNLLDRETGKFQHFKHDPKDTLSLSHNEIRSVYEDSEGVIWVGTGFFADISGRGGLNRLNQNNRTFTRYIHDPNNNNSLLDNRVRAIFEDSKGNFWVGTGKNGLHKMDRETGTFQRFNLETGVSNGLAITPPGNQSSHITSISEDSDNNLWIGTYSEGIHRFGLENQLMTHYYKDETFPDASAWWINTSQNGLIWISTQEANLYEVDTDNKTIPFFEMESSARCFMEEGSNLWIGTSENGLVKMDMKSGETTSFINDPQNTNSLSNNNVGSIILDEDGIFWIGTAVGLNRFDPTNNNFIQFLHDGDDPESISATEINVVYEDSNSDLWIGHYGGGLDKYDKNTNKFTRFQSMSTGIVLRIYEDKDPEYLWLGLGAGGGLNKINKNTGSVKQYLRGMNIRSIYQDKQGVLWVGNQNGLYQYEVKSDRFISSDVTNTSFSIKNQIWSITGDDDDNIWASSSIGILRLNKERDQVTVFGRENGVSEGGDSFGVQGIGAGSFESREGKLFLGEIRGYYAFYAEKLKPAVRTSKLYFTDFLIRGSSNKMDEDASIPNQILENDQLSLQLQHNQNTFSISYSTLDFRNADENRIYYKLENYNENWNESNAEDRATYFQVPPGNYNFVIRTSSESKGGWIEKSISIIITPPWWKTWWAYIIYGILFIFGVFIVDRYQRKRLLEKAHAESREKELEQAKEIEKAYTELKSTQQQLIHSEKMASLGELTAGIAHEIQNPLNFVNNFSDVNKELAEELREEIKKGKGLEAETIIDNIIENEEKIIHHGKRADGIVKGMLQHSRAGGGEKEPTNINELADEYLRLAYHGLRAKDKSFNADFKTELDPDLPKVNVVPQDIGRVLLNLINNAFHAVSQRESVLRSSKDGPDKGSEGGDSESHASPQNKSVGHASASALESYKPTVILRTTYKSPLEGGRKGQAGKQGGVIISIKDNGPGIPDDIKDKIFQPFFTTKSTGEGTGLGLSLSYDIVTKGHRGKIGVTSEQGEGTEFIITLPVE